MGVLELNATHARVVSVFGSSRPLPDDSEYSVARRVGRELAVAGFVVCNGGYGGIMEASARGAKDASGRTIGVTSNSLGPLRANAWIDTIIPEETLVDRLLKLIALGDAYVVLKGGTGTLLELAAVWEFMNKNMMPKKPFIAVGGFWNEVIQTLRGELAWEGLGMAAQLITVVESPGECVDLLIRTLKSPGM